MENKKILQDFVKSQNCMAKEEDKIKLIISEYEIVVDFGYSIFKQINRSGITEEDYRKIWNVIVTSMLFEYKKNKIDGK